MEILSWNILSGGFKDYGSQENHPERIDKLAKVIRAANPDVVSLVDTYRWTEVFTSEDLKLSFNYPLAYSTKLNDERLIAKGHDNGVTVMSRVLNTKTESVRIATRNAVKTVTPSIDIFSIYLDDISEDIRIKQIEEVLRLVNNSRPTIIIGDLNTIDQDDLILTRQRLEELASKFPEPMKSMEPSLNEMKRGEVTKILTDNGFIDLGKGKGETIPAKLFPLPSDGPIARLDYAFGNDLIKLEEFKVLTDESFAVLSDHYPIWMRVEAVETRAGVEPA